MRTLPAVLLCLASVCSSQTPTPTPAIAAETKQRQTAPENQDSKSDHANAAGSVAPVNQATADPAGKNQAGARNKRGYSAPSDNKLTDWLVAIFTGVLAALAILQWLAMKAQAGYMRQQETRMQEAFTVSHRPKIAVRHILPTKMVDSWTPEAGTLRIFNTGDTSARVDRCWFEILIEKRLPPVPPYLGNQGVPFADPKLDPGESIEARFPSESETFFQRHPETLPLIQEARNSAKRGVALAKLQRLFLIGYVGYFDSADRHRVAGFSWVWDFDAQSFVREASPDYEYGDQG